MRVRGAELLAQPEAVVGEATLVTRAKAERAAALAVALGAASDPAVPTSARRLRAEANRLGALLVQPGGRPAAASTSSATTTARRRSSRPPSTAEPQARVARRIAR